MAGNRRRPACLQICVFVAAAAAATLAAPQPARSAATGAPPAVGISATLRWLGASDQAATIRRLREARVEYAREDFHWHLVEKTRGTYDWSRYDRLVAEAAKQNLKLIAIPNSPPSWATASSITAPASGSALNAYIAFVKAAIARYGSNGSLWRLQPSLPKVPVTLWNIWNEPWGNWSWDPGLPNPGAYARMYKAVVQAARPLDPQARFMAEVETFANGYSTPTSFIHGMFDAVPDLGRYMDMASAHPYPERSAPTTCRAYSPSRGIREDWKATMYDFCRIKDIRAILDARGAGNTKLWITEIGFSTAPSADRAVTETQQAQYVRDVFRLVREWRIVDGLLWFSYKTSEASPTNRGDWFGLVRADGSPKPAWNAFVDELKPRAAPAIGISATLRWLGASDQAATIRTLRGAGVQYAREDFHWSLVEKTRGVYDWTRYDTLVAEAAKQNLKLIAIPNSPPAWATASSITAPTSGLALDGYIAFIKAAIARYGSNGSFWAARPDLPRSPVTIWDIWNEPWGNWSWDPGLPDPGAYARLFKAVVQAARPLDSQARFMAEVETFANGYSTPTSFIHGMFDAVPDLADYMDLASHHPYPEYSPPLQCRANSPSKGIREDWKATIYDFCRVQDIRAILDARGATRTRLWITEIGFSTAPNADRTVTELQQAQYLRDVFALLRRWDNVDGILWYAFRTSEASPTNREDWFGLVHPNGTPKPAWNAFVEEVRTGF